MILGWITLTMISATLFSRPATTARAWKTLRAARCLDDSFCSLILQIIWLTYGNPLLHISMCVYIDNWYVIYRSPSGPDTYSRYVLYVDTMHTCGKSGLCNVSDCLTPSVSTLSRPTYATVCTPTCQIHDYHVGSVRNYERTTPQVISLFQIPSHDFFHWSSLKYCWVFKAHLHKTGIIGLYLMNLCAHLQPTMVTFRFQFRVIYCD